MGLDYRETPRPLRISGCMLIHNKKLAAGGFEPVLFIV